MPKIVLTNEFHNTAATVRLPETGILSVAQVRRVRKVLCGLSDCTCGGNLGERGPQSVDIEPLADGRAKVSTR